MSPTLPRRLWVSDGLARAPSIGLAIILLSVTLPTPVRAQSSGPCALTTCLLLGATAFTVGTGVSVAYGRRKGGISTVAEGLTAWSVGFGATAAAGTALGGNRARQDRAVRAAAIGMVAGALGGIAYGVGAGADEPARWAAAVIGAATGVVAAGVYGALSYESDAGLGTGELILLALRLRF